jgi:hypothetical protein
MIELPPAFDPLRRFVAQQVDNVAYWIHPPARYGWSEGDPLPDGAKWLVCGHPTTDGTEDRPSIVHPPHTGKPQEWGWCWWGDGWEDVVALTLIRGGLEGSKARHPSSSPEGAA